MKLMLIELLLLNHFEMVVVILVVVVVMLNAVAEIHRKELLVDFESEGVSGVGVAGDVVSAHPVVAVVENGDGGGGGLVDVDKDVRGTDELHLKKIFH